MTDRTNGVALVLAAHGSATDGSIHELVNRHQDRLRELTEFDEVSAAYHLGAAKSGATRYLHMPKS
jgi:hypothetical protein